MDNPSTGTWSGLSGPTPPSLPPPTPAQRLKKALLPLAILLALLAKFKTLLLPLLKFFPILLKTGGTMLLTIWLYATQWGVWFAVGFVLLIFVHECGHLLAARRLGLKVGAPVFIPFLGAFIALKEAPRHAWIEAQVGIGGPILGALGAALCLGIGWLTGNPFFFALAYTGCFLNLFNLAPVGFLDGGRIVTALSPWLWLVGIALIGLLMVAQFNFLLFLIFLASLPRLFSLFRQRTLEEQRYYEVTPAQRWLMGTAYFGLAVLLAWGMAVSGVSSHY